MQTDIAGVADIGRTIQLSVAPVFLLVAVGSLLNVMTQRLGRVIDRARRLEEQAPRERGTPVFETHLAELAALDRRIAYAHWAINFCVGSALLVALDVAVLFFGQLAGVDLSGLVAALFILAMAGIIGGLSAFMAEISVATRTVRVRRDLAVSQGTDTASKSE